MPDQPTLWDQPVTSGDGASVEPDAPVTATRDAAYARVACGERESADAAGSQLGDRQQQVYDVIRRQPDVTNMELSKLLGWTINRITPRTKELRERGLVIRGRRRGCQVTGNTVQAWKAVDQPSHACPNPMVRAYGYGPRSATCETCRFLRRQSQVAGTYYKCTLRSVSRSASTDQRMRWPACKKYEETFDHA